MMMYVRRGCVDMVLDSDVFNWIDLKMGLVYIYYYHNFVFFVYYFYNIIRRRLIKIKKRRKNKK